MNVSTGKKELYFLNKQKVKIDIGKDIPPIDIDAPKPALELLSAEGGESFYYYIDWLGLSKDPNLIVLSSMHHYYYDTDDLKETRTVVNLLPLNQIKHVKGFFHSIYHLIPHRCYFIGCFVDHRKHYGHLFRRNPLDKNSEASEHGIVSGIPILNIFYRLIDQRTDKYLTVKNVTISLEDLGFKVLDMTELNGITYFCAHKVQPVNKNS
jgi:hypothetical protein